MAFIKKKYKNLIYKTKTLFIKTGRTMLYLQCRLYFLPSWQFCSCCKKRKIKQTIYTHNDLESSSRNRSGELLESTRDGMWQRTQFSNCRLTSMLTELEATLSTESSQEHLEYAFSFLETNRSSLCHRWAEGTRAANVGRWRISIP